MTAKILATLTALVGGAAIFYVLLVALGIEISAQLQDAITGLLGLVLVIAGIWLHPSTTLGQPPE